MSSAVANPNATVAVATPVAPPSTQPVHPTPAPVAAPVPVPVHTAVAAPTAGVPISVPQTAPAPVAPPHIHPTHAVPTTTLPTGQMVRPAPATVAPAPAVAPPAPQMRVQPVATPLTNSTGTAPATAPAPVMPVQAPVPVSSLVPKAPPKSKKSKAKAPTVTMATAATATPSGSGQGSQGENTGRWTAEEHRLFLQGLEQHGKGWKKIASLIKSRTVVQIRTHAQKYFQKLAKARQNGEEGDVSMEGRGGTASVSASPASTSATQSAKRRRQSSGTKRKAISSVVASAQREGKKMAVAAPGGNAGAPVPPLPAVAPALSPYVVPTPVSQHQQPAIVSPVPAPTATAPVATHGAPAPPVHAPAPLAHATAPAPAPVPSITTAQGTITGAQLEDSLFRYLTPSTGENTQKLPNLVPAHPSSATPPVSEPLAQPQLNDVARQAGANPITLPSDVNVIPGEGSPTGVADFDQFPSWTHGKDATPSWYAKGSDVDELLNEADALDWLADTGDLSETYQAPASAHPVKVEQKSDSVNPPPLCETPVPNETPSTAPVVSAVPSSDEAHTSVMPPLLEGSNSNKRLKLSSTDMFNAAEVDDNFAVFDTHFDEQAFVSALLENNGESTSSLPVLS